MAKLTDNLQMNVPVDVGNLSIQVGVSNQGPSSIVHDDTLVGAGTTQSPLGVSDEFAKKDDLPEQGLLEVSTDDTLTGKGTTESPLSVSDEFAKKDDLPDFSKFATNDDLSNYLTDDDAANIYLSKEEAGDTYATKSELTDVFVYKGSVENKEDLPADGNKVGDVWNVQADDVNYAWDGTEWDALGPSFDSSLFATKDELGNYVPLNKGTKQTGVGIYGNPNGSRSIAIGGYPQIYYESPVVTGNYGIAIGLSNECKGNYSVSIGYGATVNGNYSISIGSGTCGGNNSILIGGYTDRFSAKGAIYLKGYYSQGSTGLESFADNTFYIGLNNYDYMLLGPDGLIPGDRLASGGNVGNILSVGDEGLIWKDATDFATQDEITSIQNQIGDISSALDVINGEVQ